MPTFQSTVDATTLFYRYYTPDSIAFAPQPTSTSPLTVVFLHGWPMSSRMYDHLIVPLCETHRYPCIAPDRRGFGHSDWNNGPASAPVTWDTFAADLVGLLQHLQLGDFVFVSASMGCGESVLAYLDSPFVRQHCKGFVWIGPNMPYNIRSTECPDGPPPELLDFLLGGIRGPGGKGFIAEQVPTIFRTDLGNDVDAGVLRFYEGLVAEADPVAIEKTPMIFQKPLADELRAFAKMHTLPVLMLHGDSDSGMPVEISAKACKEMIPWAELKVYEKAGHGLYLTHARQVLDDLLGFFKAVDGAQ